jgi:hypothetical protein
MGLLDRFFSKKPPTTNCDWCGIDFSGPGVKVDDLVYCSEECLSQKQAPAKAPEVRSVHAVKKMTLDDVGPALAIARGEMTHFRRVLNRSVESELSVSSPTAEGDIHQLEFEFWRSLDDVRAALLDAGRDVSEYDALREQSMINSIELRSDSTLGAGVGLRGPKLTVTKTVTADFSDGNMQRMRDAIAALERGLG